MSMENSVDSIINKPFSSRSFSEKLEIVASDKPTPKLNSLTTKHKSKTREFVRHFSESSYENIHWLTGCDIRSKLFCWPCLFFSTKNNVWTKVGFSDLNHFSSATKRDKKCSAHVQAFLKYRMFGNQRIDTLLDRQQQLNVTKHNEAVKKNREVMKRLIDSVPFLAEQELPLRGHEESESSLNKGNYVELLNLFREYDPLLDKHLESSALFKGTSPHVQNDIAKALSRVIINYIKKEISYSPFVAIILDETSDITTKSQLTTVLRYIIDGKICERFIGFTDVSADRTANGLFKHVEQVVNEFGLQQKLVGQTYDGASVMSGHINGLQKKVIDEFPLAIFTHCYAHVLNLVLQQSLSTIKECRIFFKSLNGLTAFFSRSSKRVHELQQLYPGNFRP